MAEVLAPLPQSSTSISMLHSRSASADALSNPPQPYQAPHRSAQAPRAMYNASPNTYRGAVSAPVQPYAFQSTPHLRHEHRNSALPTHLQHPNLAQRGHTPSASTSSASDTSSLPSAKDDSVMGSQSGSTISLSNSQLPELSFTPFDGPVKASPDRYRRPGQKRTDSNSSVPKAPAVVGDISHVEMNLQHRPFQTALDDLAVRSQPQDIAKRYRRRSLNTLDTSFSLQANFERQRPASAHGATSTPTNMRPISFHTRSGSECSDRDVPAVAGQAVESGVAESGKILNFKDSVKPVIISPRESSVQGRRAAAPSPLSRQTTDATESSVPTKVTPRTYAAAAQSAVVTPSPAAQQLAAVSDRDLNKGMKSRLRRAFSFGSAQELRRAAMEGPPGTQVGRAGSSAPTGEELDAEQMEIARRQEAAGIGAGIYSGQGGFVGSTDNLSISSTASSASMMLRKMGRGAKKSAKSIKGLFRPKSVIGVPAADGPILQSSPVTQPTIGQVSMVTVEAERLKVNVNAAASEKANGGTGFPKLERNSIDAANSVVTNLQGRGPTEGLDTRRSIVGNDKDRAEVLAAVKKGILKRAGTASPNGSPVMRAVDAGHTPVPHLGGTSTASAPNSPRVGPQGRTGDYFSQRTTKSVANTPNGVARGITFSPRIQFHDAWSSSDYDRRGDVATCNRLTPMLAQQIKEELNTFKMEMEVHELSKPHTHFF